MLGISPALHLLPKSLYGPVDEAREVTRAANAVRWTEEITPVWFGCRQVACVYGDRYGQCWIMPANTLNFAGFPNGYFDILTAARNGQNPQGTFKLSSSGGTNISGNMWSDTWSVLAGGSPGYSGTTLTARQFTDASIGAIQHGGNVSPAIKALIGYNISSSNGLSPGPLLWLYDRVISYDECTIAATTQTMTNSLTAQRWVGSGLPAMRLLITSGITGSGATASHWTSIIYANDAGTGGSTVPLTSEIDCLTTSSAVSSTHYADIMISDATSGAQWPGPFTPLQTADIGVSSVTSYVLSAANTGTLCYALVRPLLMIVGPQAGIANTVDAVHERFSLARIFDGSCLGILEYAETSDSGAYSGSFSFAYN